MNYQIKDQDLKDIALNSDLYVTFLDNCRKYENKIKEDFFTNISKIIHEYTGVYRDYCNQLSEEQVLKVKECILLAEKIYEDACKNKSIEELLTSLHILFFFGQNIKILDIKRIKEEFKKKIITVTSGINLNINIPEDAPYSTRKMMNIFSNAKENNDFSEVIGVMDNLIYHSDIFSKLEYTWASLINFAAYIDKNSIVKILEETTIYEKIDVFLYVLKDSFYENINFNVSNKYLLLRMFKYWIDYLDSKYFKNNNEKNIPDYTKEMAEIFSNSNLEIDNYIEVLRLQYRESYNYLMGKLIAVNEKLVNVYLKSVSYDKKSTIAFTFGFLQKLEKMYNEQILDNICNTIEIIKNKFFEHEVHHHSGINQYTGYLDLFFNYFNQKNTDKASFLNALSDIANKIQKMQNSWNHKDITKVWVEFFYLCLSNVCQKYIFTEAELEQCVPVLFDERNKIIYDGETIEHMKQILMYPDTPIELNFQSNGMDYVTLKFN